MPGLALALLQLAAPQAGSTAPDIEFNARVRAREVTVRQEGEASLALRVSSGQEPPVEVERSAPAGAQTYRNLEIRVRAAARLADPNLPATQSQQGTTDEAIPR